MFPKLPTKLRPSRIRTQVLRVRIQFNYQLLFRIHIFLIYALLYSWGHRYHQIINFHLIDSVSFTFDDQYHVFQLCECLNITLYSLLDYSSHIFNDIQIRWGQRSFFVIEQRNPEWSFQLMHIPFNLQVVNSILIFLKKYLFILTSYGRKRSIFIRWDVINLWQVRGHMRQQICLT